MTRSGARPVREPVPTLLQLEILRAKVGGKTDAFIARAFKIGDRTVRRHLDELIGVLGVSGRAELYAEAARRGWLDRGAHSPAVEPLSSSPEMFGVGWNRPT